ncbi:hypothetical protein DIS24_g11431 [Lasiodiplodia hormozganensis]|uniref:Uncharacterized protein n=1 Tax=Lasiodiplodia hormozganensis TaxID=869390 RepID=A0AA39WT67_9PEZI|nr:hypothetical protein DIS24_g11431 [Lasiodiplodia hormozganensis]
MENPFWLSHQQVYGSTAEMQAWNTPGTNFQDTAMSTGAPVTRAYVFDHPIAPSSNSMSSEYTFLSAESSIAGDPYLASRVPGSSYSADTHTPFYSYTSPFEPHYASVMRTSPEPFESDIRFGFGGGLVQEDDLSFSSPATSSNGDQAAAAGLRPASASGRVRKTKPRQTRAEKPNAASRRASSGSAGEANIICSSCQHKYSCESSLLRHRNESCRGSGGGAKRLFYCDPFSHPGCKKGFKRRDNLKQHYRKLGRPEEWIDEKIRERYGKGMHSRPI